MRLRFRQRAFTLVEVAVVLAIIGLLLGSLMYTLSAQTEQRARGETQRTLEQAREAILGYAVANGRLPCPASAASMGVESPAGGGDCTNYYDGFLPAVTLGFQPVDAQGFALDAWNNRIRYAVAATVTGCTGTSTLPHFTSVANLKANGMSCRPNDLDVCTSAACAARVVSTSTAVFVVFSTGKNGALTANYGADEQENTNATARFVLRTPGGTADPYDDLMVVIPVGILYSRLTAAGVLP
jgi:prepilin-type N-terminal cleavage/methylation domain-containing protein